MRKALLILFISVLCTLSVHGQESGNRNYNRNNDNRKPPTSGLVYNSNGETYIEAYVLLNVAPDEFVAVFGASHIGATAVESNQKLNEQIAQFLSSAERLGIPRGNSFVDFITQNRIYEFNTAADDTIIEKLVGFETKKNIAIRYTDRSLLEKLLTAAAEAQIFDLIKVDYVVNDMSKIRSRLFEEAVRVVKQKEDNYTRSLGMAIRRIALQQETYDTKYPAELYQTYTAYESGGVDRSYDSKTRVIRERKSSTSYLEPLDRSAFDSVLNSIGIEPVVQCTLYMRVLYSTAR